MDGGPALESPTWEDRIKKRDTEPKAKKRQPKPGARRESSVTVGCCASLCNPNPHPEKDKYYVQGATRKAAPKDVEDHLKSSKRRGWRGVDMAHGQGYAYGAAEEIK